MVECEIVEYPSDSDWLKNIEGKIFNNVEIIEKIRTGANGKGGRYICKCVCGKIFVASGSTITSGHKKSCGCKKSSYISDKKIKVEIEKKYGELTVVRRIGKDEYGKITWLCLCSCGKEVVKNSQYILNSKVGNCGTGHVVAEKKFLKHVYNKTKQASEIQRKIYFNLSMNSFEKIIFSPCFYCGSLGNNSSIRGYEKIIHNGVDRIDSNGAYDDENCVPCCADCNYAKGSMNVDDFYCLIVKIYKNLLFKGIIE